MTATSLYWIGLRNFKTKCGYLLTVLLLSMVQIGRAQNMVFVTKVPIKAIRQVSVSRYGQIVACDNKGNVLKFDTLGNLLNTYSPSKLAEPALIEAWNPLKLFVFYRNFQEYVLLDRFLTESPNQQLPSELVGFARVATLASNDNLWVIDDTDFSLKKIETTTNRLVSNTPLGLLLNANNYDIDFMREYQNMLYVNNRNTAILVFDNFGNYKKKLPYAADGFIGFVNEEIYYLKDKILVLVNLYTFAERQIALPADIQAKQVLLTTGHMVIFSPDIMYIYKLTKP